MMDETYRRKSWLRQATIDLWTKAERHAEVDIQDAVLTFLRAQRKDVVKELKRLHEEKPGLVGDKHAADRIIAEAFDAREWDKDLREAIGAAIARTIVRGYLSARVVQAGRRRRFPPVWRKGGAGSGNFGHGGRPGQVGGSSGNSAASSSTEVPPISGGKPLTVYKGVPAEVIDSILAEGIHVGDKEWHGRPRSVYLTSDFTQARIYGARVGGKDYAIIEFIIPPSVQAEVKEDEVDKADLFAYRLEHDIPSEWIRTVHLSEDYGDKKSSFPNPKFNPNVKAQVANGFTIAKIDASQNIFEDSTKAGHLFTKKGEGGWADMPLSEDEIAEVLSFELPPNVTRSVFKHTQTIMDKPYWKDVNDTERQRMLWSIQEGVEEGKTLRQIAKDIQGDIDSDEVRARRIAVTESNGAFAAGHITQAEEAEEAGVKVAKVWVARMVNTRATHEEADGQVVEGSDGVFTVGGYQCTQPGDPDLPAEERINCYCGVIIEPLIESERAFYRQQGKVWIDPVYAELARRRMKQSGPEHWVDQPREQGRFQSHDSSSSSSVTEQGRGNANSAMNQVAYIERAGNPAWTAKHETGWSIMTDGTVMEIEGDGQTVFGIDPADRPKFKDSIFTHNHPGGSRTLSGNDVAWAVWANVAEMRAFGIDEKGIRWVATIKRPPNGWPKKATSADVKIAYNNADARMRKVMIPRIARGEITLDDALRESREKVHVDMARKFGFGYERREL